MWTSGSTIVVAGALCGPRAVAELSAALAPFHAGRVRIDLSAVTCIDSIALAALLRERHTRPHDRRWRTVVLSGRSPHVCHAIKVRCLDSVFDGPPPADPSPPC